MTAWLLGWVWQGLVVVLTTSVALACWRRGSAHARYLVWAVGLVIVLFLGYAGLPAVAASAPAPTLVETNASPVSRVGVELKGRATPTTTREPWLLVPELAPQAGRLGLSLWALFALVGLGRLALGALQMARLKRSIRPLAPARQARLAGWTREQGLGRSARLGISDQLDGISVLGLSRPCIAIGRELAGHLSDRELDQVVLHELGHVRRHDDWARLVQATVACLAGLHPAVWLIGRGLDLERETACDEWAIARTGAPREYAACLVRVAETRLRHDSPALAPALLGPLSMNRQLVHRIDRALAHASGTRPRSPLRGAAAVTAATLAMVGVAWSALAVPVIGERTSPAESVPQPERGHGTMTEPLGSRVLAGLEVAQTVPTLDPGSWPDPTLGRATSVAALAAPTFGKASAEPERPSPAPSLPAIAHAVSMVSLPPIVVTRESGVLGGTLADSGVTVPSRSEARPRPATEPEAPIETAAASADEADPPGASQAKDLARLGGAIGSAVKRAGLETADGAVSVVRAFTRAF